MTNSNLHLVRNPKEGHQLLEHRVKNHYLSIWFNVNLEANAIILDVNSNMMALPKPRERCKVFLQLQVAICRWELTVEWELLELHNSKTSLEVNKHLGEAQSLLEQNL